MSTEFSFNGLTCTDTASVADLRKKRWHNTAQTLQDKPVTDRKNSIHDEVRKILEECGDGDYGL